jgi:uncharacterized protein YPO0396
MNPIDEINLQAFLDALAKLDRPLDVSVQQKLKQLSSKLAEDATATIEELVRIAENYSPLKILYETALDRLLEDYQTKSRNKFLVLPKTESQPKPDYSEIRDLLSTDDPVKLGQKVLSDDEPVTMAKYVNHLSKIYAHALEVFDNSTTVWSWLNRPNRALGGAVPLELLETDSGTEQVDTILGRIEYGVYS